MGSDQQMKDKNRKNRAWDQHLRNTFRMSLSTPETCLYCTSKQRKRLWFCSEIGALMDSHTSCRTCELEQSQTSLLNFTRKTIFLAFLLDLGEWILYPLVNQEFYHKHALVYQPSIPPAYHIFNIVVYLAPVSSKIFDAIR